MLYIYICMYVYIYIYITYRHINTTRNTYIIQKQLKTKTENKIKIDKKYWVQPRKVNENYFLLD